MNALNSPGTGLRPGEHVLFQGDSITDAFRKPEELNNTFQLGAGYAMIAAAQLLATRPKDQLKFTNRGVSGEGIAGLEKRWQADCLDHRPDVLSLLVGINDSQVTLAQPQISLEEYRERFRRLLSMTRQALPNVRLILCEPFVLHVRDVRADRLNDVARRGEIVAELAREFGAAIVLLQAIFQNATNDGPAEYWSYDGIHPNAQGHWLIAQAWLKALNSL